MPDTAQDEALKRLLEWRDTISNQVLYIPNLNRELDIGNLSSG